MLGITAQIGRTFPAGETRAPGSAPLVMLGDGWWTRRFGRDPSIVGRTIGLNGVPQTVVGVLPRGFKGMTGQADAWAPLTILRLIIARVVVVALAGIALGLMAAVPAMQLLATLLYRVTPRDPFVYAGLALLLLAVAVLAGYLPARRATRVDPLLTLRSE